ncbi:hypothetical protein HNP55_001512 [Paucibacter oligotrophus]|uniref:Transmembrane protein n=1 Tax=Roseateles oligotrophus TaxID=1769250 RepID=A0A840LCF3_9BURK|nr:hypothetical protein [Roseateles oligotrophus]MBB4842997.1 hypothetical protein [Roseateles oligotrophus]
MKTRTFASWSHPAGPQQGRWVLLLAAALLSACSPGLDWREARPEGSNARLLFPCKPDLHQRAATAEAPAAMGLAQCKAAGATFALSWAQIDEPGQIGPALQGMRESLATKLAAQAGALSPVQVAGMTPSPFAQQQSLSAKGQQAQVAVFTRGQQVYQALVLGPRLEPRAWQSFVESIKLGDAS